MADGRDWLNLLLVQYIQNFMCRRFKFTCIFQAYRDHSGAGVILLYWHTKYIMKSSQFLIKLADIFLVLPSTVPMFPRGVTWVGIFAP